MIGKADDRPNVAKVMEEFQKSEGSSPHHNGTFKINTPFEKALDIILKPKPTPVKRKQRSLS